MADIRTFPRPPAAVPQPRRKVRLEPGIYEDQYGRFAVATRMGPDPARPGQVKKHYKESAPRQPFSTPIETMRAIAAETREGLARQIAWLTRDTPPAEPPSQTSVFRQDVPIFLATFTGTRKQSATNEMRHWVRVFGDRPRQTIQPIDVRRALSTLSEERSETTGKPLSPGMIKHLRNTLSQFYDTLNSKSGYNPVREVKVPGVVYDDPRYVPPACVALILAQIDDYRWRRKDGTAGPRNLTKLRLQCIYAAGLAHAMLARIEPRDLHFDQQPPMLYLRARRKGKNAKPRTVPVGPEAVVALTTLAAHHGLGSFSRSSLSKTVARARTKAMAAWEKLYPGRPWPAPLNVRSYDFRHTFATEVLMAGTPDARGAVMDLLGHSTFEQGERYTQGAASMRSQLAITHRRSPRDS